MIRVHIERVVLDGLEMGPGDAAVVRAAVERHLAGGLRGRRFSGGAVDHVRGRGVPLGPSPALTGFAIASSVAGAISGPGSPSGSGRSRP